MNNSNLVVSREELQFHSVVLVDELRKQNRSQSIWKYVKCEMGASATQEANKMG